MNLKSIVAPAPALRLASLALAALLVACSGTPKPKPAELPPNVAVLGVNQAWSVRVPGVTLSLQPAVNGDTVTVASTDGTVVAVDARSGRELWRANAGAPLTAGVGSDGDLSAVVTRNNEVVVLQGAKVLWKERLVAETFTAPLVAGRRVFVQLADRSTVAFDGQSGRRLWQQERSAGEALVLRRPGVLQPVGDTLLAGAGARLIGMNPGNGASRWEVPVASPRGTNDVERLVDLTGPVSRVGDNVCARAYYAAVGCVDTSRGALLWTQPAVGATGVTGDADRVYGTEANGTLVAWNRANGSRAWSSDRLRLRALTAPLVVGNTLIVGEDTGTLHFFAKADGAPVNRLQPDGSAIAATPVMAGNTVVVVTRNGGVFGYRPE
ncbi:outer membrane protein assembly factor BamB [Xenophilus arseniciresistens]|uniref:Outer membrane protein assembly factor BamB n=1 Tax=Xenophilus arseniciresistens TaxID=1283306 RepID=A0AAE3N7R4_9BURK|nr:outer membrane protein assembly factor BamB [Xenophilus arseniciresistens]MDA7416128.1 outer membrane protein assembly factor BamB [Xenophilus arseniciresistens]